VRLSISIVKASGYHPTETGMRAIEKGHAGAERWPAMATGRHVRKFRKESPRSSGSPATEFLKKPVLARSPVGPPPALNQSGPTETRHRELDRSPRGLLSQAHHNPTSPSSSYSSSRKRPPA